MDPSSCTKMFRKIAKKARSRGNLEEKLMIDNEELKRNNSKENNVGKTQNAEKIPI